MASRKTLKLAGIMMKMKTLNNEVEMKLDAMRDSDPEFEEAFNNRDYERLKEILKKSKFRDLIKKSREMIKFFTSNCAALTTKSDEESDFMRTIGNNRYTSLIKFANTENPETMVEILYSYHTALSQAKTSDRRAKVYGNLSAVYLRLKFVPQTLSCIEYALKNVRKSDHVLINKLEARRLRCQEKDLQTQKAFCEDRAPAELSYPPHSNISGLVGVLKLRADSIVTEKPLKAGDIVAITKSFCFMNDLTFSREFCNQCGDKTSGVRIPCDFCCTFTFCGESCKALAMEGFHDLECNSLLDSSEMDTGRINYYFALKFAFKAIAMEYNNEDTTTKFTCFDWKEGDEKNEKMVLKTILNMKPANLNFKQMLPLVSYFLILMERTKNSKKVQDFLKKFHYGEKKLFDLFCKSYLVVQKNNFHTDFTGNVDWLYGNLKHACKPNVMIIRDAKLGTNNYVVIDDIAANEELTVAYGKMYFYDTPVSHRQAYFRNVHGFTCKCYACKMKLPTETRSDMNQVFALVKEIFVMSVMKNKNMNTIFKEIVQELCKRVDNGSRRTMIENLYEMSFMPYNLNFSTYFRNFMALTNSITGS